MPVFLGFRGGPAEHSSGSGAPWPQHPTLPPGAARCPLPAPQRKDRWTALVKADLTVTQPPYNAA